ncbi:DivIVA domain-containing protein [Nonomuraea diastatica]|uniref:DivIVA domain-containing protein n=1 Tax=Nonomuraea diastatica TaxID=1848329 RepID=A0A4R4X3V0_9ACTN|nr:DivIVA domain-containing protein [Nonomuraea diastatica]
MPWGERPSNDRQRLTPERVRNKAFSRTKLGHRGYSEDEVRTFLYRMADDMAAGDMEKADLRAEVERLKNWYKDRGTDVTAPNANQQARLSVDASTSFPAPSRRPTLRSPRRRTTPAGWWPRQGSSTSRCCRRRSTGRRRPPTRRSTSTVRAADTSRPRPRSWNGGSPICAPSRRSRRSSCGRCSKG